MRWAFWRKPLRDEQEEPPRPLPSDAGLSLGGSAARPATAQRPDEEPDTTDPVAPAAPAGSRPAPSTKVPQLPDGPVPPPADSGPLDRSQLPAAGSALVELVRGVLAGSAATPTAERVPAAVATAVLSARLPLLSGVTGSVHDDPDALRLQLAYADLLAGRAEHLRRTAAAQLTPQALRTAARDAAGAVTATDPPATGPRAGGPDTRLLAAAVLLAQTCLDGGGPVEALPAEVDGAFSDDGAR